MELFTTTTHPNSNIAGVLFHVFFGKTALQDSKEGGGQPMQKFGYILMIARGIMVRGTLEGGGSYAIGFWGFVAHYS